MLTRVYMKWVPLLVVSGGTGISAELVGAFAVTVALSNRQDKLQVLWWRLGHGFTRLPKPFFETFAKNYAQIRKVEPQPQKCRKIVE